MQFTLQALDLDHLLLTLGAQLFLLVLGHGHAFFLQFGLQLLDFHTQFVELFLIRGQFGFQRRHLGFHRRGLLKGLERIYDTDAGFSQCKGWQQQRDGEQAFFHHY